MRAHMLFVWQWCWSVHKLIARVPQTTAINGWLEGCAEAFIPNFVTGIRISTWRLPQLGAGRHTRLTWVPTNHRCKWLARAWGSMLQTGHPMHTQPIGIMAGWGRLYSSEKPPGARATAFTDGTGLWLRPLWANGWLGSSPVGRGSGGMCPGAKRLRLVARVMG